MRTLDMGACARQQQLRHSVPHPCQVFHFVLSRAMASSGSREQFLRQMEQIVEGIKQNRMKVWLPSLSLLKPGNYLSKASWIFVWTVIIHYMRCKLGKQLKRIISFHIHQELLTTKCQWIEYDRGVVTPLSNRNLIPLNFITGTVVI